MKTPDGTVAADYDQAHEVVGRFVLLSSMLDYRLSQLLSRWFSPGTRLKFLSNVVHSIDLDRKLQIIGERLSQRHVAGEEIVALVSAIDAVFQRRELAIHGVLGRMADGRYCLRNLAAHRAGADVDDALPIDDIPRWSEEAMRLTSEITRLTQASQAAPA